MQLIDFNAISIAAIMATKDNNEEFHRHIILNGLRLHNVKNREKYGDMVICCDSKSWRRDLFPQYKANRNKESTPKEAEFWSSVFSTISNTLDDLREHFHYRVVKVDGCEADDIIGTLVEQTQEFGHFEEVMIISGDKDFAQLQKYDNVNQYSPVQKKFIKEKNPRSFLMEHIIKGDVSDGIPNILSDDNCFVESRRQTPLRSKKKQEILDAIINDNMCEELKRNYMRNKKLIDLDEIPSTLKQDIINTYEDQDNFNNKGKILPYLISRRHNMLIESVQDFF